MGRHARYHPLRDVLAALPAEQSSITLTLAELEALVGPLPFSARATVGYWTSSAAAHDNWRAQGFSARYDRAGRRVTFTRLSPDASR